MVARVSSNLIENVNSIYKNTSWKQLTAGAIAVALAKFIADTSILTALLIGTGIIVASKIYTYYTTIDKKTAEIYLKNILSKDLEHFDKVMNSKEKNKLEKACNIMGFSTNLIRAMYLDHSEATNRLEEFNGQVAYKAKFEETLALYKRIHSKK